MPSLISLSFNSLTPKNLGVFTNNVVTQMSNNALFVSLKPEIEALKSAYELFWAAYTDALKGGSDRIILRDVLKEATRVQLYTVALLVEILAKGDRNVALAAGFEVRKTTKTASSTVSTPTNLTGTKGDKIGSVSLSWKGDGKSYDVECFAQGAKEWKMLKTTTQQSITVYGFELGSMIQFRVSANGVGETESDYSTPIEVWISNI